ncbi:hypothetical protein ACROYT_G033977 [Oculina patagonica]
MKASGRDFVLLCTLYLFKFAFYDKNIVIASGALDVPCNSSCLLVSTQTEIVALDYNNGTSYPIISNLQRAVAIDIHFSLGYIFWSDFIERNIKRANIDGTNVTELHNIGDCFGLAVEWGSSQLYWTDEVRDTISVSDLEGNNTHILISSSLDNPRGIALDPHSGIDLDRRNRLVFWVDGKLDRVESVDYHGNNRKLLFQRQRNDILFYGVTFFSSYLFVSNWANGVVYKFNATNANVAAVSSIQISQRRRIDGLVAYDSSRQSPVITCPALPAPSSGTRLGCPENTTMYYDTVCQFACNNGYIGSGSQVRRCQHNGTWSGQDFTCQIINYTSLTVDPSGPLRMSSCDNHYGAECKLTCTIGYRLNGSSAVACVATGNQHTGVWNSTIPTVKENWKLVTCPVLHAPSNGTRLGCPGNATMYYNTTCQSSCNNGYIGSGSKVRRCQHSGTWSGQDFTCQIINCTLLTIEPSGLLRMSSCDNHYGSQCNFSCTLGHRLNGSSTVTCVAPGNRHPGVWNKAIPTCEASLKTREESVLLEVKDLDIKKWNKQTEKDFKIEVARLATDYCAADGTRCELIPASSRGKRSSDNLVFSRDRVHVLSDYPKQLSDDPLIALIAFYLQFPQALSDDIVVKDVLVAIMESHVSSIERSINGTILSVKPLFSDTETTEESDEESKPTTAIIIGVCVGVLVIIIAVVWACKRINSSKKMAETSSYNNNAYVGNTTNYITSEGQVTEMKNMETLSVPCNSPCLLFSTYSEIVALDYNNATIYPIISNLSSAVAIDVHFSLGYIFWSEYRTQTIKRANIDGTNITILHEHINCYGCGLAVEWTSSQLYWTSTSRGTISVSDLEGNNKRILFSSSIGSPRGIVLDPFDWLMFWTDWRSPRKIWRATLSGTQAVPIVTSNLLTPYRIDLDRQSKLVFWVDGWLKRVESVDYYGNNRKLLFQAQQAWFSDVTFLSSYVYVSDWNTLKIYKFNATSANGTVVSNVSISQVIDGLVAYDISKQLPGSVILMGDFNSRTGKYSDTVSQEGNNIITNDQ